MEEFQAFNPNSTGQLIIGAIFYILLAIATILSIANIFVLIRRSKERSIAFFTCVIYIIIFMAIVGQGIASLNRIA